MNLTTERFSEVFHSTEKVQGLTHNFYKYPARFSADFVRLIIEELSEPGDYVLDPFMGGGTTIVEAVALGRRAIGTDINSLAHFVTRVKTTPLSKRDISEICSWVESVGISANAKDVGKCSNGNIVRNLPVEVHPYFSSALALIEHLRFPRQHRFARCALLRVGQWALDCTSHIPQVEELCDELAKQVEGMIEGLGELVVAARKSGTKKNKITGQRQILACSADAMWFSRRIKRRGTFPKLILTSPPYPGVHVLYHRWQVQGRRETPAPYWLADLRDGHGASHYTMGSRSKLGLKNYFEQLSAVFSNLRNFIHHDALVVQLVSFADADTQLQMYLDAMSTAGFNETSVGNLGARQVRLVPHRKWYTYQKRDNDASREMLLIHRPASGSV